MAHVPSATDTVKHERYSSQKDKRVLEQEKRERAQAVKPKK